MATRLVQAHGTAAQWAASNDILSSGQEGLESDTGRRKVGDGSTHWNDLAYNSTAPTAATPTASTYGGSGVVGTSPDAARADHKHALASLPAASTSTAGIVQIASENPQAETSGASASPGSTGKAADAGHVHAMPSLLGLSSSTPSALSFGGSGSAGTDSAAAHADHVHALPAALTLSSATPSAETSGAGGAVGTATTAARADHVHALPSLLALSSATPSTQAFGDSASVGTDAGAAHADHKHAMPAAPTLAGLGGTQAAIMPNTPPAAGRIPVGNSGGTAYAPVVVSKDATLGSDGALTVTGINGTALSGLTGVVKMTAGVPSIATAADLPAQVQADAQNPAAGTQTVTLDWAAAQIFPVNGNAAGGTVALTCSNDTGAAGVRVIYTQGTVPSTLTFPGTTTFAGTSSSSTPPAMPGPGDSIAFALERKGANTYLCTPLYYTATEPGIITLAASGAQTVAIYCGGRSSIIINCHASGNALSLVLLGYTYGQRIAIRLNQGAQASTISLWFNSKITDSLTISSIASTQRLHDTAGQFLAAGFRPGGKVYVAGAITAGTVTAPVGVVSVTANDMELSGAGLTDVAAGSAVTVTSRRCTFLETANGTTAPTLSAANKQTLIGVVVWSDVDFTVVAATEK